MLALDAYSELKSRLKEIVEAVVEDRCRRWSYRDGLVGYVPAFLLLQKRLYSYGAQRGRRRCP
jgi:hypothetical protein